jgi:ribonuclease-3
MLNKIQKKFQKIIEYKFNNFEILITALMHKSYAVEAGKKYNNERMELLGDSILSAIVVDVLYLRYPYENEGMLSKLKSQVISSYNLSMWAKKIDLGNYILLGKGENTKEARKRKGLLCDVFEAVTGGIYLDGGFEHAKKFILKFFDHQKKIVITDYKSKLQEIAQSIYGEFPDYRIIKEFGPGHVKKFDVAVYINNKLFGVGVGNSKKEAQQFSAKQAIKNIRCKS